MKILIMGLPGSGKTTLAESLTKSLGAIWFNADRVREEANDWDFSYDGRIRQANRMKDLCNEAISLGKIAIADFVATTPKARDDFDADFIIWMNTIIEGRFRDTNKAFVKPTSEEVDLIIYDWGWNIEEIISIISKVHNGK